MKIHTIIPDALYQRGEFYKFPLQQKLDGLKAYGIDVVVNTIVRSDTELIPYLHSYIHQPLPDGKSIYKMMIYNAAREAIDAIDDGHVVLTHCHAGKNRSGLINCLIVMELLDMTGTEALAFVRQGRPNAVANPYFQSLLHNAKKLIDVAS
jgi:protein-tyrosine phosphatase